MIFAHFNLVELNSTKFHDPRWKMIADVVNGWWWQNIREQRKGCTERVTAARRGLPPSPLKQEPNKMKI